MAIDIEKPELTLKHSEQVYQLGHAIFTIKNCDDRYKDELAKLLPHYEGDLVEPVGEIETGCSRHVLDVIRQVVNLHHKQRCVWIEGICLLTPAGQKVLLAGKPQSGKSTTAMALVLRDKWKVLCENFCIIDYGQNQILKFLTPAALDSKALKILMNLGVEPAGAVPLEWRQDRVWAPLDDHIENTRIEPTFDFVFLMDREAQDGQIFSHTAITAAEFGRKILALSNLLKIQGSYDCLMQSLSATSCHQLSGGELVERLNVITEAVAVRP